MGSSALETLAGQVDGEVLLDSATRRLYASDASMYQVMPAGVVRPRHHEDCVVIVDYARRNGIPLIPRGAATSLAGQCVGEGLVVDCHHHMNRILALDPDGRLASVQPGVTPVQLNESLRDSGCRFAPYPSTGAQCTIGGMLGNNAWGVHAPRDGTTRDHVAAAHAILPSGEPVHLEALDPAGLREKMALQTREGQVYRTVFESVDQHLNHIRSRHPGMRGLPNNAGYPLDVLARGQPWVGDGAPFNLAPFLCGSEGTLALVTEITVGLVRPPSHRMLLCAHFNALREALRAAPVAVRAGAAAAELITDRILQLARNNPAQAGNCFWVDGEPRAVLLVEFSGVSRADVDQQCQVFIHRLHTQGLGYAFPVFQDQALERIWQLRRTCLGLLMGESGKRKWITGVEDTAVPVAALVNYVSEVQTLIERYGTDSIVYGSASLGVLHLRPALDLRSLHDRKAFESIMAGVAELAGRYGGTVTAKHGDGRLRAPFLRQVLGTQLMDAMRNIKAAFDPDGLLNPGKILDPPPLGQNLRTADPDVSPLPGLGFDWGGEPGLLSAVEKCNGAGVCLQTPGRGVMCPSYQATREERDGTRGRANLFAQLLREPDPRAAFDSAELRAALDLCLACKGCKSECPANVDMARIKSEFLHQHQRRHGPSLRSGMVSRFHLLSRIAGIAPRFSNAILEKKAFRKLAGLHPQRPLPRLAPQRFTKWWRRHGSRLPQTGRPVVLLVDPFMEFYEPAIARAAVRVLSRLGFAAQPTPCLSSGRVEISQGALDRARETATRAVTHLRPLVAQGLAVIGLEPSELLTFRDEIPDLLPRGALREAALEVAANSWLFEEWICHQRRHGVLQDMELAALERPVRVQVHCHQKSLSGATLARQSLEPVCEAGVAVIPAGCCGLAGVFGYEREHYELSVQIAGQVLVPSIEAAPAGAVIVATGHSCRQQINHATGRPALHPAQIWDQALSARGS